MHDPEMWEHYCDVEHTMMGVGKGEPCNWCEKTEEDFEVREFDEDGMYTTKYLKGNAMALKEKDIIATDMEHKPEDPYRNYAKEAIDILERIHQKVDRLLEQQKEHLEEGHPRDDGK